MDNNQRLKRGIISVLVANIINLVISIFTNFFLPKYLSVASYAAIKTYQLYLSYAGVLHFGFVDGMLIKYGGLELSELNKNDLKEDISTFRLFQIYVTILLLCVGIVNRNVIYITFVLSVFSNNMISYYSTLFQATGEFSKYSRIRKANSIATFIVNIFLLLLIKTDNYISYITVYIILSYSIWIYLELLLSRTCKYSFFSLCFKKNELFNNIRNGILLMLGNFSNALLTGMDRWFIKFLMATSDFAQYSFATSMEHFIDLAVGPLSITLYNYFCREHDANKVKKLRNCILLFAFCLISMLFPVKFILQVFLNKYLDANQTLVFLLAAQVFYILIKSIYVNLYKATRRQNRYFFILVVVIIVGFILNIICYKIKKIKEAFAVGTMLSALIWYLLSSHDFKEIGHSVKEGLYIVISVSVFIVLGLYLNPLLGFLIYILYLISASFILMRDTTVFALNYAKNEFKKISFKKRGAKY